MSEPDFRPTTRAGSDVPTGMPEKSDANEGTDVPRVFTPLKLRGVELKNRFVVSPMCMYSCEDGFLNDYHLVHLGAFALRGAALTIVEATAVVPEGRISPRDAGLWKSEHIPPHKRVVDFIHTADGKAGIQLAHAGRKASTYPPWHKAAARGSMAESDGGWSNAVYGPSDQPYPGLHEVRKMTVDDIRVLVRRFADSAKWADIAGYDVIEIHAAHGYLLHSFLSPKSNTRTDEYGGSFENRTRIVLEVFRAVRLSLPAEKPVFVRFSCTDWLDGGWDIEQSVRLAAELQGLGADLVDCSSAGLDPAQRFDAFSGFQIPFAEEIRKQAGIPTAAVGLIQDAALAEKVVRSGYADLVFVAREFLRDPGFVLRCADELGVDVAWPRQYERAKRKRVRARPSDGPARPSDGSKLVVLISGNGSNLQALIDACASGELPGSISLVVSNRKGAYGLERAARAGIPTAYRPLKPYTSAGRKREEYDADLARLVLEAAPDLVVLAGWMHVLSPAFLVRFAPGTVINLHPALPGAFDGADAIGRAYRAYKEGKVKSTGVTVHYVIPEVDRGEPIVTREVAIYPTDDLKDLEERIHVVEHKLIVQGAKSS